MSYDERKMKESRVFARLSTLIFAIDGATRLKPVFDELEKFKVITTYCSYSIIFLKLT